MNQLDTLKSEIRLWEKKFIKKNGRKPLKSDISKDKTIGTNIFISVIYIVNYDLVIYNV